MAGDGRDVSYTVNANGVFRFNADQFNDLAADETLTIEVKYTVSDGAAQTPNVATITVNGANDAPVAEDDSGSGVQGTAIIVDALDNDFDPDGDAFDFIVTEIGTPSDGSVQVVDGKLVYTSDLDFSGTDSFTYRIEDANNALSNEATVTIR